MGTARRPSLAEKRHWLGGLQSLAAAGAEHCPIGVGGAEGPGALQVGRNQNWGRHGGHPSLKNDIGLEGCSPLQPPEPNIVPSDWAAPMDRRPCGLGGVEYGDGTEAIPR